MIRKLTMVLAVACVLGTAVVAAWGPRTKTMSVQNQRAAVRAKPSSLGKVVASLTHGDAVEVLETKGAWLRISKGDAVTGWMHKTALVRGRIRLAAGAEDAQLAASSDEVAMAGKGFNEQVEAEFKAKHQDIDFAWVDRMEKITVSDADILRFMEQGGLSLGEGGAQ